MKSLTDRILSVLRDECRLTPDDLITVGVSGGIDSMFLLVQLYEMKLPLIAAVFNHGLRPEAADECRFVLDFCRQKGIPCICGEADVHGYAADKGLGIEEAARQLRYRFLFDTAVQNKAAALVVAVLFCTRLERSDPSPPRGPPLSGEGAPWNSRIARAAGSSLVFRSLSASQQCGAFFVISFLTIFAVL